jgi:uncharacterized membrane protein YdjX (TVP38/TMEM64 family)
VHLLSGLTEVNVRTYMAATALGILPAGFVYTFAGRQFGTLNSLADIVSFRMLLSVALLGLLPLTSVLYRYHK